MSKWSATSWKEFPILQHVDYEDEKMLQETLETLQSLPPLVTEREIQELKKQIHDASLGKAFILQGGDCSELFSECNQTQILNKFKILLQMSVILIHSLQKPVIRIGRIAGQYAKPRSQSEETINGVTLPAYRGDMINDYKFTQSARNPDPHRMQRAYEYAAMTLNYLRALSSDGFADLHHPRNWQLDFMETSESKKNYQLILNSVSQALSFVESILEIKHEALEQVRLFISHEALHLPYESALTRENKEHEFYNVSTHFPWVGMRTLAKDSAHIEYLRGIKNPVGIKVGPTANLDELLEIISILNPENEMGKIVLIHRFGKKDIIEKLPILLERLKYSTLACALICDPMHGNTHTTSLGIKTRHFDDILSEITHAFAIHKKYAIPLAGIHFEMTGDDVTECLGGSCGLNEEDLTKTYTSLVDPRLNYQQAIEMALKIAEVNA